MHLGLAEKSSPARCSKLCRLQSPTLAGQAHLYRYQGLNVEVQTRQALNPPVTSTVKCSQLKHLREPGIDIPKHFQTKPTQGGDPTPLLLHEGIFPLSILIVHPLSFRRTLCVHPNVVFQGLQLTDVEYFLCVLHPFLLGPSHTMPNSNRQMDHKAARIA